MILDFLYLIGGPLDGIFMPANPRLEGMPTEIIIWDRSCGWHCYQDAEGGGLAKVDVYKIVSQGNTSFMRAPKGARLHEMNYVGAVPLDKAKEIERLVREQRRNRE